MVTKSEKELPEAKKVKPEKGNSKRVARSSEGTAVPLYVRINPIARRILERASRDTTNAKVVEALLENYVHHTPTTQEKILKGQFVNPHKEYSQSLASLLWAQHAFDNKRYILATRLYSELMDSIDGGEGYRSFFNYKLGVCWIRLSYECRKEAIAKGYDQETYELALGAITTAMRYSRQVKGKLGGKLSELVMHYNLACCYSLRAQYMVEARLDLEAKLNPQSKLIDKLRDSLSELRDAVDDLAKTQEAWNKVGLIWRDIYKGKNVDAEAQLAINELHSIYTYAFGEAAHSEEQSEIDDLAAEGIWLAEAALKDEDFLFLRSDEQQWQAKFNQWIDSALHGDKSMTDAIRTLMMASSMDFQE